MSELTSAVVDFREKREPAREIISGWMVNYEDRTDETALVSDKPGYVYVLVDRGEGYGSGDIIRAFCRLRPVPGWAVRVSTTRDRPWEYTVLEVDRDAMGGRLDGIAVLEPHHETHEWGGSPSGSTDVVYPRFLQLYDFGVWPGTGKSVNVNDGVYDPSGTKRQLDYTNKDLTPWWPSGTNHRWCVVCLSPSGTIEVWPGDAVDTGTFLDIEDIPEPPYDCWWQLAAVRLVGTETEVTMRPGDENIIDLRFARAPWWPCVCDGSASGTFDALTDTPASKVGSALQHVRVNAGEDALEYTDLVEDHDHTGDAGDGGQLDHGAALTNLADDDHTQYLLNFDRVLVVNPVGDTRAGQYYATIPAALAAASSGDAILVMPGTYAYASGATWKDGVALIGLSLESTIIQFTHATSVAGITLGTGVTGYFQNFTLHRATGGSSEFCIEADTGGVAYVSNCHLTHAGATSSGGLRVDGGTIHAENVTALFSGTGSYGFTVSGSGTGVFRRCSFSAIYAAWGATLTLDRTTYSSFLDSGASLTLADAVGTLASIKIVDGTGSGLDADLLDGVEGAAYVKLIDASYAWATAISAGLALPALRVFYPMSSVDYAAATQARDISGGGYHLTNNNGADFGFTGLIPHVDFNGTNQYLNRADAGVDNWSDITGLEAYVPAAQRGLTFGCWVYQDGLPAGNGWVISKYAGGGANQRAYGMILNNSGNLRTIASNTGVATFDASRACAHSGWHLCVFRFVPSTQLDSWVDTAYTSNTTSIPASIFSGDAVFCIGAEGTPGGYLNGRVSLAFMCAAALSDVILAGWHAQTRALFGV